MFLELHGTELPRSLLLGNELDVHINDVEEVLPLTLVEENPRWRSSPGLPPFFVDVEKRMLVIRTSDGRKAYRLKSDSKFLRDYRQMYENSDPAN